MNLKESVSISIYYETDAIACESAVRGINRSFESWGRNRRKVRKGQNYRRLRVRVVCTVASLLDSLSSRSISAQGGWTLEEEATDIEKTLATISFPSCRLLPVDRE